MCIRDSSIGSDPNGNTTAGQGKTKYDADVRSELITSWEAGAELKFFNNRLGADFAWYKTNAKRQLVNIPLNNLSGYDNMKVNAVSYTHRDVYKRQARN